MKRGVVPTKWAFGQGKSWCCSTGRAGWIAGDAGDGRVPFHGAGSWESSRKFSALQSRLSPVTLQSGWVLNLTFCSRGVPPSTWGLLELFEACRRAAWCKAIWRFGCSWVLGLSSFLSNQFGKGKFIFKLFFFKSSGLLMSTGLFYK